MKSIQTLGDAVPTQVRYLSNEWRESNDPPRIFDRTTRRANTTKVPVLIRDARELSEPVQLDVNGFELFRFDSPITDFKASNEVSAKYHPAIAEFVKQTTCANEIYVTHHLIRTEDKSDFNKAYARFVHCDYDMGSARSASLNLLQNRKLDTSKYEDAEFAWYNSWQPFDNPVEQSPLAMLDAATIRDDDIVEYVYGGYGKSSKSSMPTHRDEHQFYYFKRMLPSEVLLIKQLDSRPGRAKVAPHTSFIDPSSTGESLPRRSIEVRMMAVFHPASGN